MKSQVNQHLNLFKAFRAAAETVFSSLSIGKERTRSFKVELLQLDAIRC
jgi:hypothetical protein